MNSQGLRRRRTGQQHNHLERRLLIPGSCPVPGAPQGHLQAAMAGMGPCQEPKPRRRGPGPWLLLSTCNQKVSTQVEAGGGGGKLTERLGNQGRKEL